MDKRIIILICLALILSSSFVVYRKIYYKAPPIQYTINPKAIIKTNDSISYENQTADANRWKWDFGDGEFSALQSGSHIYMHPGHYMVKVAAYGNFGMIIDSSRVVDVMPSDDYAARHAVIPEGPSIAGPASLQTGNSANYETAAAAASYEWTVEGDATLSGRTQKGKVATWSFSKPGHKTLVLTMHTPDAVIKKDINVTEGAGTVAGEHPLPPPPMVPPAAATASAAPKKHEQAVVKPHEQHPQPVKDKPKSKLKDVGDGVEY